MNPSNRFHILVVEDDALIAADIEDCLLELGYQTVSLAENMQEAQNVLEENLPDLALLDIHLGENESGIQLAHLINKEYRIPFIYLTAFSDDQILEAAKETVPAGFVLKPFHVKRLKAAIGIALHNYYAVIRPHWNQMEDINEHLVDPLTHRELQLLRMICQGIANRDLAAQLSLSINTIKTHLKNLYLKLQVRNRAEAILKVQQLV